MKRMLCMLIITVILAVLVACGTAQEPTQEPVQQPTVTVVPQEEYDALDKKHMTPLLVGMVIAQNWQDANEVEPERFMYYFGVILLESGRSDDINKWEWFIPAEELEPFVQSRFNVTTEHLRSNRYYSAEKNAYDFGGLGSSASSKITGAVQRGKQLTIEYDLYGPMDYKIAYGKLEIELDVEDYKNSENYRYLSNQFERSVQSYLDFPSGMREIDTYDVFMMDSGGRSSTSSDGVNYKHYDGEDLASIIAFYENEALPALEAQGTADTARYEDGWYWEGTYRGGKPLAIDVQHRYGADTYVITALYEESSNPIVAENTRHRTFMQPPDLNSFASLYSAYLWKPYLAGVLGESWSNAESVQGSSLVAFYALNLSNGEKGADATFPAEDVERYIQRYFGIGTDTMRAWDVYDKDKNAYAYHPEDVATVYRIVSATSYGSEDEGEPTQIMLAYEIRRSEEDSTVIGSGELTIELSGSGYQYLSNNTR